MSTNAVKHFKIADICVTVDTWCEMPQYDMLVPFEETDGSASCENIYVRVRLSERISKQGLKLLAEYAKYSIYTDGEYNYRFYTDALKTGYGEYACTRIKNGNSDYIECFVYEDNAKAVPEMKHVLGIIPIEVLMLSYSKILLHSSYIVHKDKAILFSAPCGTGKSTQAALWEEYENAVCVNGDRAILGKNSKNVWTAYGLPFCGSSKICKNISAPIRAIVILRQAKENSVKRLNELEAFKLIYSELTLSNAEKHMASSAMDTVLELIKNVPVYLYACTKDALAVEVLKNELENGVNG